MLPAEKHTPRRNLLGVLRLRRPPSQITRTQASLATEFPEPDRHEAAIRISCSDPFLAVWLIKRANSEFYGFRSTVDSVYRAVNVLGPDRVLHMIAGTGGSEDDAPQAAEKRVGRHSLATAFVAQELFAGPRRTDGALGDVAFTAGLLHDLGKLILAHNCPEASIALYGSGKAIAKLRNSGIRELETVAFGYDHLEIGEYAARKLHFPDLLTDVIRLHGADDDVIERSPGASTVYATQAAGLAASAAGYASDFEISWDMCIDHPIWTRLRKVGLASFKSKDQIIRRVTGICDRLPGLIAGIVPGRAADRSARELSGKTGPARNSKVTQK